MPIQAEHANDVTMGALEKALSDLSIISEPIEVEDIIIIPIAKIGMTFGASIDLRPKDTAKRGSIGGIGAGGGISPSVVLIASKRISGPDGVEVIFLKSSSPLAAPLSDIASKILEMIKMNPNDLEKMHASTAKEIV